MERVLGQYTYRSRQSSILLKRKSRYLHTHAVPLLDFSYVIGMYFSLNFQVSPQRHQRDQFFRLTHGRTRSQRNNIMHNGILWSSKGHIGGSLKSLVIFLARLDEHIASFHHLFRHVEFPLLPKRVTLRHFRLNLTFNDKQVVFSVFDVRLHLKTGQLHLAQIQQGNKS